MIRFLGQRKINTDVLISDLTSVGDLVERGFKRVLASNDVFKSLVREKESRLDGQSPK
jgi:hypothetical protein